MKRFRVTATLALLLFTSFPGSAQNNIDVQGHRGARGLAPENTVPAFIKAVDLGVQTLEMDVVITQDRQVVVSHDPFMSHEICLDPKGQPIDEGQKKDHNIYTMTYSEVQRYDCGSKGHPAFPGQSKIKAVKPLLSTVIDTVKKYEMARGSAPVRYNIEIKSTPAGDGKYHPPPFEFVQLVIEQLEKENITDRVTLQSFDMRALRAADSLAPGIPLALLVENDLGLRTNIQDLGFIPAIYSPHYTQVDRDMLIHARVLRIKIIPWTVNKKSHMKKLFRMGVDGIITDYPNLAIDLSGNKNQ